MNHDIDDKFAWHIVLFATELTKAKQGTTGKLIEHPHKHTQTRERAHK